jgi:predicted RNA-binding protein with PUA-like domain
MKSEPEAYSIDDLMKDKIEHWDGIRNYQARNIMRDEMTVGDYAFFYHSNAKPTGIVGVMKVNSEAYPDHTAQDPKSNYYDPKATKEKPIWEMVDMKFVEKFNSIFTLEELKSDPKLIDMMVVKRGMRLSIQPVSKAHFKYILKHVGSSISI